MFISSDSSSKEEDVDDNDSSSTASSFPIDECDWDYFEPGGGAKPALSWSVSDEDAAADGPAAPMDEVAVQCEHQRRPCRSGGAPTFIPIPVPVPIPFPVPWTQVRLPRHLLACMSQALIWPLISGPQSALDGAAMTEDGAVAGHVEAETRGASSSDSDGSDEGRPVHRVYTVNGGDRESDDALPSSNVTTEDEDEARSHSSVREDDLSSSGSADTDSDE